MHIYVDADACPVIAIIENKAQKYNVAVTLLCDHQSGKWYTNDTIDRMLMERYLNKKARRSSNKAHLKGPKKRTKEDDERFAESFERLIQMALAAS